MNPLSRSGATARKTSLFAGSSHWNVAAPVPVIVPANVVTRSQSATAKDVGAAVPRATSALYSRQPVTTWP